MPTCTEDGLTEGKKCSVCGEVLLAQEVVPAKGHTEEVLPAVDADCENTGLTEGKKCSVCDEVLLAQEVVPAKGHNFVDGSCTVCGEETSYKIYYHDENGEEIYVGKYFKGVGLDELYVYELTGYNFIGWTDMFTGEEVTSIPADSVEDVYLIAVVEAIEYVITYVVDGETYTTDTYVISEVAKNLIAVPAKDNYKVIGWQDAEGNLVTEIAAGTTGNVTLTAVYEELTFVVTYKFNDGVSEDVVVSFKPSEVPAIVTPANREGYLFGGWYTDAEFAGTPVTSLESVSGEVVLYAKWTSVPNEGGTLTPEVPFD